MPVVPAAMSMGEVVQPAISEKQAVVDHPHLNPESEEFHDVQRPEFLHIHDLKRRHHTGKLPARGGNIGQTRLENRTLDDSPGEHRVCLICP